MREPRAALKRPVTVLRRLQDLIGQAMALNSDRNPNRMAQVTSALTEAHELCWRSLSGEDLPEPKDHSEAS